MSIRLTPCAAAVAAAVLQMTAPVPVQAATCTLTVNGLWQTPGDWSCAQEPGAGDSATINVSGLVTINQAEQITTLSNAGTINISSGSLTLLGGGSTTNSGTINVGSATAGALDVNNYVVNIGGTINVADGSAVNVNNGTIAGGTLATTGTGVVSLANSSTLDGVTHGAMTLAGNVTSATNQTNYFAGTFTNTGNLTVGTDSDLRIQGTNNVTLNGTGTVTLAAGNSRLFGDNGSDLLTIGAGQTVQGVGQLGINSLRVMNSGLITANQSGGTFTIDPTDGVGGFTNTGTLRAEGGGILSLTNGTYANNGGTIAALGGSSVTVSAASVQGGTISTTATGTVVFYNSSVLDGLTNGTIHLVGPNVSVGDNQTVFALGTLNGSLTIGTDADLRAQNTNNLTLTGGTTTLSAANTRLFGDTGTDIITNTSSNTIQGQGQIGINQAFVTNAGVITANVAGGTLVVDPTDGTAAAVGLTNTGTLRAENGATLQLLAGFYDNSAGHLTATGTGSSVTITNGAVIQGGPLTATAGGAINVYNSAVLDGATRGAMTLTGPVTVQDNQTVYGLGNITDNTLTINTNADFRIQGANNLTLTGGTTTLVADNSRLFGDNAADVLTNTASNTIQGRGQIGINQTLISNAGLITANINGAYLTIDPTDGTATSAGLINTGTLRAENGATLQLLAGYYDNSAGHLTATGTGSSITITNGAVIQGGPLTATAGGAINLYNSALLDGATRGAMTLSGPVTVQDNQTVYGIGNITDSTLTINTNADFRIQGANNLTLTGGTTTLVADNTRIFGDTAADILTNTASNTLQGRGQIGVNQTFIANAGLITANVSGTYLTVDPTDGDSTTGGLINTGTLRAESGGNLQLNSGHYNNQFGTIEARTGSSVSTSGNVFIEGGTLATAGTGSITLTNNATLDGTAHGALTINGAVSVATNQTVYLTGSIVNNGSFTQLANTDVRVAGTSDLTLSGTGTYTMTAPNARFFGDVGTDTLTNGAGHTIQGLGQLGVNQLNLTNAGTINANVSGQTLIVDTTTAIQNQTSGVLQASGGGTLNLVDAVNGTGTIRSDSGGTVVINAPSTTGQLINNASLSLGANNITVSSDYNNASFGTGNGFNNHAGVTGTGLILASGNAAQAITGATVTNGTGATPTLTINNVRVGATSYDYQVANSGTSGPAIRGAIQTSVNGGNITDARLSGSGVTSSNYGPVATGSNSGDLAVTFTATSAGLLAPLSGQAVHIANNFDNLSQQTMNIVLASGAAAYNAAAGNASAASFGNTRVGGTLAGAISVGNAAPAGSFSEDLNASIGTTSGATASGSVSHLIAGGTSNAISAALSTSTAGAKNGSVTLNYQTAGTVNGVSNGLAPASVGSQTVGLTGNVYQTAAGSILTPALNFGTVQVGQMVSQILTVKNTATGPSGFVEDLNASFGATSGTGASLILGSGSISGLIAGATSNGLTVSVNTSAVGTVAGSIAVNYVSAGAVNGVGNGLGTLAVGSDAYGVSGTITTTASVVNQAKPVVNTPTIALGNVRIGATSPTGTVSVTNQATTAPQAALNASISGNAPIIASGSFNLLNPGSTDSSSLHVGFDTSTAGAKNGTATIAFVSDASNIGGCAPSCALTLPSQDVAVTGAVYRLANPSVGTATTLAARVGGTASTSIAITNSSPDIYTEGLTATRGATSAGFTSAGSITNLAAQGTSNAITVALNTATAGTFGGTQALAFASTGAGTTGAADLALAGQNVVLNGKVYTPAVAQQNTASVNFGIVHVGDSVAAQGVSVTNAAPVTALNDVLVASSIGATGPFTASGSLGAGLAAGQTSASALKVGLSTTAAGVYSGSATFSAASHDGDLSDAALSNLAVSLIGQVNNYATDAFKFSSGAGSLTRSGSVYTLDFGSVASGSGSKSATLVAGNTATGPADLLDGNFVFLDPAEFGESGFSSFSDLAAGGDTGALGLTFDTSTVGSFTDTIVLHGIGENASGYSESIDDIELIVRGTVTGGAPPPPPPPPPPPGVPEPATLALFGLGIPLLLAGRGRRRAAKV